MLQAAHSQIERLEALDRRMEGPCASDGEEDEETLQQYAARRLHLAELPSVDISASELDSVYEPSDDTFLLLDALEADRERLTASAPALCMEIGCGSGVVITSLSKLLPGSHCMALDINETALAVARRTAELNGRGAAIEFVRGDLLTAFRFFEYRREPSLIDVLIFNPPYVPSEPDEIGLGCKWAPKLSAAWAGGIAGREVIDRLLPQLRRCADVNRYRPLSTALSSHPHSKICRPTRPCRTMLTLCQQADRSGRVDLHGPRGTQQARGGLLDNEAVRRGPVVVSWHSIPSSYLQYFRATSFTTAPYAPQAACGHS